jgi:hypothetical protein
MNHLALQITLPALAGAALLAAVVIAVRGLFRGYPPSPHPGAKHLGRKAQAVVAAAADALFPPAGPIPISGSEAGLLPYMDAYLGRVDARQRGLIGLLLHFVEHAPLLLGPRRTRFTRLSLPDRIALLRRLAQSDVYFLRVVFLSLRVMLTMGYLANPEVAKRMRCTPSATPFEGPSAERPCRDREVFA